MNSIGNAFSFFSSSKNVSVPEAKKETKEEVLETEFHQICRDFPRDLSRIRSKYPLITIISIVVLGFLGVLHILSFSVTNILTGVFFEVLAYNLSKSIQLKGIGFFSDIQSSIQKVIRVMEKKAEEKTLAVQSSKIKNK